MADTNYHYPYFTGKEMGTDKITCPRSYQLAGGRAKPGSPAPERLLSFLLSFQTC